ncbi:pH-response regulator protein palF/RIM8 [[Candida] zeylanoides]
MIDLSSIADFYIAIDEPHKSWLPGDEISGQIILISRKNLANIAITLALNGYIKINASSHSKLRPVKHVLFNHTIKIYGEEDSSSGADNDIDHDPDQFQNGLYKGEHRFPFIVKLPNKRTSEKLINIISPIDVAKLSPPKPKRLTLKDPRNSSRKLSRTQSSTSTINTFTTLSSNNSDTTETNRIGDQHREEEIITQLDDAPNVNLSAAIGTNMLHPVTPSSDNSAAAPKPSVTSTSNSLRQRPDAVRVSLEISDSGYLRGELIPIKLNISHLKKIQDSNGIIITFLRVCRLENGPDGLFDSFRKDLYQSIIPLYVDPCTLKSEINTSVRVPADAFPTISGCPLVSFQYFIEVLINLSGKSIQFDGGDTNTSASNAKDSIIGAASNTAQVGSTFSFDFSQPQGSFNSKERSTYINTDKYKRMKKFLQLTSEVIVGTHRSKAVVLRRSNEDSELYSQTSRRNNGPAPDYDDSSPSASENLVPLPHQSAMSEKEQMIVREASLMPSAPPLDDIEEDSGGVSPVDHNEDIMQHIQGQGGPSQGLSQPSTAEPQDGLFFINADRDIDVTPDGVMIPQPIFTSNDESNNSYSDIDFVPKYELSGNDVAIEQAGSPNVSETATYQAPRQERGDY